MLENEMEKLLEEKGYVITVGEQGDEVIDSTLVSEFAIELGYDVKMNENSINEFTLKK